MRITTTNQDTSIARGFSISRFPIQCGLRLILEDIGCVPVRFLSVAFQFSADYDKHDRKPRPIFLPISRFPIQCGLRPHVEAAALDFNQFLSVAFQFSADYDFPLNTFYCFPFFIYQSLSNSVRITTS